MRLRAFAPLAKQACMKIVMVTYGFAPFAWGGAETQAFRQAQEMVRQGHEVHVLTARLHERAPATENLCGVHVHRSLVLDRWLAKAIWQEPAVRDDGVKTQTDVRTAPSLLSSVKKVAARCVRQVNTGLFAVAMLRFFRRERKSIDAIYVHTPSVFTGIAGWVGNKYGIRVVCKASLLPVFSKKEPWIPGQTLWEKWKKAVPYIALTDEMAEALTDEGVDPARLSVTPNGIAAPRERCLPEAFEDVLVVGNFSQGAAHKAYDIVIRVWGKVCETVPQGNLLWAGGGDASEWKQAAIEAGLANRIQFLGYVENMDELYRQSALFFLPSRREGMSNALLEAGIRGLPSVVSDIPGNQAVVVHQRTGLVCPVDNVNAMSRAMIDLLSDADRRAELGAAAAVSCNEQFGLEAVVRKIVAFLGEPCDD